MMRLPEYVRSGAQWVGASLVAVAATVLMVTMRANSTTAGMVYLVLVVWFSSQAGFRLAGFVTLLCAVEFDYFFLPPLRTLQIIGVEQWVALISFLASCVVVARVAELARRRARQANARREDMERLYTLAQEVMLHEDAAGLIRELPRMVARIFALEAVLLYVRDEEQLYSEGGELPMSVAASLQAVSVGRAQTQEIPGGFTAMPLLLGLRPVGALAFRPDGLSREVAASVAAQAAILLARAAAVEAHARIAGARESDRLRTALVDSISHEFRTPLTSIRAAATTLRTGEGMDASVVEELAAVVDEESARLDRLIGEAVEMAEIDAEQVRIELGPEHPRALLEQAVAELRTRLAGRRVSIVAEEPDDAAWFDRHLLGRVLHHLLENAARFTPEGGRITLRCRRAEGRLEFQVEDEGPGIHPADLPYIFERFYRGKKGQDQSKGTGMGLAIARSIVRAHGGGIEAVRGSGQGACFRFWVPETGERDVGTRD
jgi:two-component system sensor histidine kinase KdpD